MASIMRSQVAKESDRWILGRKADTPDGCITTSKPVFLFSFTLQSTLWINKIFNKVHINWLIQVFKKVHSWAAFSPCQFGSLLVHLLILNHAAPNLLTFHKKKKDIILRYYTCLKIQNQRPWKRIFTSFQGNPPKCTPMLIHDKKSISYLKGQS